MKKLKILLVTQGKLANVHGGVKVHYDLKQAFEKRGHQVDVLDYSILFPNGENFFTRIFGKFYTLRIRDFLKANAHKYDVIDANYESVTFPKSLFSFKGVLLGRSHGILPLYREAEKRGRYQMAIAKQEEKISFKTRIGNLYRYLQKKQGPKEFFSSVHYADVLHCLNGEEYSYFVNLGIAKAKIRLVANGIPDSTLFNYGLNFKTTTKNAIAFVGSWTLRKGVFDFDKILTAIRSKVHLDEFLILGCYQPYDVVIKEFSSANRPFVKVIPSFKPEELSLHLSDCKVGVFPSYVEGFGFAIVEQLACGIPVVAYNTGGPQEILSGLSDSLLVELGDTESFGNNVVDIMTLEEEKYFALKNKCRERANEFKLSSIAEKFLDIYQEKLEELMK